MVDACQRRCPRSVKRLAVFALRYTVCPFRIFLPLQSHCVDGAMERRGAFKGQLRRADEEPAKKA